MSAPDRRTFVLRSREDRTAASSAVAHALRGYVVTIRPPSRTLDQNARLHAMLSDIAASGHEFNGRRFTVDELKTLFVSAWMIEHETPSDIVTGFNGEAVQLRRSTTTFSKEELGSLMDLIEAFCAQQVPAIVLGKN
jgi:ribonuclease PH